MSIPLPVLLAGVVAVVLILVAVFLPKKREEEDEEDTSTKCDAEEQVEEETAPDRTAPSANSPKKGKNGSGVWFVVTVVALIAIATGYLFLTDKISLSTNTDKIETPTVATEPASKTTPENPTSDLTSTVIVVGIVLAIGVWAFMGYTQTKSGTQKVVLIFGKAIYVLKPGPGWYPLVIGSYETADTRITRALIPNITDAETNDGTYVEIRDVVAHFRIVNAKLALFEVGNLEAVIIDTTTQALTRVVAGFPEKHITSSDTVGRVRKRALEAANHSFRENKVGILLVELAVKNISRGAEVGQQRQQLAVAEMKGQEEERLANAYAKAKQIRAEADAKAIREIEKATGVQGSFLALERIRAIQEAAAGGGLIISDLTAQQGGNLDPVTAALLKAQSNRQKPSEFEGGEGI